MKYEVTNLQSEGHGIANLPTMLSIGLGQDQQFTLILQTLQQLRDVYGDTSDQVIQGNTSNIIFLKSTDDAMIQRLETMSGKTHKVFRESKSVTVDKARLFMRVEDKVTYTYTTKEMPVISYNDMAFISERNSILFRAGDSPVWNRNETILPMSWRLFQNTIKQPGKNYTLQTIPTLSSAMDFDVRKNQPDFYKMWEKRRIQARYAAQVQEQYKKAYGYSDMDIAQMDPNLYADEIMDLINQMIREQTAEDNQVDIAAVDEDMELLNQIYASDPSLWEDNDEIEAEAAAAKITYDDANKKRYAGGRLSRADFKALGMSTLNHGFDREIIEAFRDCRAALLRDVNFQNKDDGNLYGMDGTLYIAKVQATEQLNALNKAAKDKDTRVFAEAEVTEEDLNVFQGFQVTDAFINFLIRQESWNFADRRFEEAMSRIMGRDER